MNIEDQVCGLENAKRLKELGLKWESLFSYGFNPLLTQVRVYTTCDGVDFLAPAYTVAELFEMLPKESVIHRTILNTGWHFECGCMEYNYVEGDKLYVRKMEALTMADSAALMLIWLIENNHVSVKELNEG